MAKRRKASKRSAKPAARKSSKGLAPQTSSTLMQTAERAVLQQSGKMLVAANKRYKQFVRQAAKATNDRNKKKYLAAALTAVMIAGVVARDLKARMDKPRAATRKKRL